ncbi:hemolysin family protein [Arsenicicoccus piscis]|uniref:Membrane protein n=1 Tax=Arsenicicoccus piscis TaxID=673954 RepID=A0ABQ6HSA6_9MICO|nr:hemolysin family protein [Arsenicicoccus piscis]MCH8626619.1 hemolysin family protein [Arsenicicoccus piscis]GMA21276.1 membrane protein [Arsenicicoccus piscis]
MNVGAALLVSLGLLVANAFFVAAEFAIVAAKRHRLDFLAAQGSSAARAAVRNSRELSLMLAGAQLGITLCTLALGALAKPAIAGLLADGLGLVGVPDAVSTVIGVVLGVSIVVFLHMVVGEMAPKSWAISDAERSAVLLAWPFRAFVVVTRPLLTLLNHLANLCLRAVKVEPQDELANVHGPQELRMLLDASRHDGQLPDDQHRILSGALALHETPVYDVTLPLADVVEVPWTATALEIERASRDSGRSRLVVVDDAGTPVGLVHVRDAVRATARGDLDLRAGDLVYDTVRLDEHENLLDAVSVMQEERSQLAFVTRAGRVVGITALEDLLERMLGEFDDETDPAVAPSR